MVDEVNIGVKNLLTKSSASIREFLARYSRAPNFMLKIIFWLLCKLFEDCSLSCLMRKNYQRISRSPPSLNNAVCDCYNVTYFFGKVWLISQLKSMLGRDSKASYLNSEMLDSM